MPRHSLRTRLLVGSILWTIGLLFVANVAAVFLVHWYFDGPPRIVVSHANLRLGSATIVAVASVLMLAGFYQVRRGLAALDRLRDRLASVRSGESTRLEGRFPAEVEPLVNDLNSLLAEREATVQRALAKAGDLAHGLKTPLAVLAQEAESAAGLGAPELAETLHVQIARMRRQVEFHLAHARAAGASATHGGRSSVRESAEALVRTLSRLYAGRGLTWLVDVPADLTFRGQREDLDEMLGNLLDNACKWAAARVALSAVPAGERLVLAVEDDGPGIDAELREQVLQRGVRADEAAPGSGLGLAIVRDLAELYGGAIRLDSSGLGGALARLELPRA